MAITSLAEYPDLQFYQLGLNKTGNSYARGDLSRVFIAPILYNAQRPAKIELTYISLAAGAEVIELTSPVDLILYRETPLAVGNTLGTDNVVEGVAIVAEDTVIPATIATAVPILPYVGPAINPGLLIGAISYTAVYKGLVPCLSVEEATFPQISSDASTTQNKTQGFFKTADKFTGSWTSNLNGAFYRQDPAIPLLETKAYGWGKIYFMVTQAPFDEFDDGEGGVLRFGAGPGASEGLACIANFSITDGRSENQKLSCSLTGDGTPNPYSILTPDI